MESIKAGILSGRHEIVDADLSGYFDSIPHQELMKRGWKRVRDKEHPEIGEDVPSIPNRGGRSQEGKEDDSL